MNYTRQDSLSCFSLSVGQLIPLHVHDEEKKSENLMTGDCQGLCWDRTFLASLVRDVSVIRSDTLVSHLTMCVSEPLASGQFLGVSYNCAVECDSFVVTAHRNAQMQSNFGVLYSRIKSSQKVPDQDFLLQHQWKISNTSSSRKDDWGCSR